MKCDEKFSVRLNTVIIKPAPVISIKNGPQNKSLKVKQVSSGPSYVSHGFSDSVLFIYFIYSFFVYLMTLPVAHTACVTDWDADCV